MTYTGLIAMEVNVSTHVALIEHDPGMRYELEGLIHEVESQDKHVMRILIYEGDMMAFDMRRRRVNGRWSSRL